MTEEEKQAIITQPHGREEAIKMQLLGMVQEAADPFDIIYAMAEYLETASGERGYAQHLMGSIRTIYGQGIGVKKPMEDDIVILEAQRQKILAYLEATAEDDTVSEDERARLTFAEKAHERKIAKLQELIKQTAQ